MPLAVVSEISRRFRAAVAKWQPDPSELLECRFLLRDGYYVGHRLSWGAYRGVWFSDPGEMKIYRDEQWLMTLPVLLSEVESVAMAGSAIDSHAASAAFSAAALDATSASASVAVSPNSSRSAA